jgi:hypothetical protein
MSEHVFVSQVEAEAEESFDEFLDESYPPYEIAGVTLWPSRILYETDPIAYRTALSDYTDSYVTEYLEMNDLEVGPDDELVPVTFDGPGIPLP